MRKFTPSFPVTLEVTFEDAIFHVDADVVARSRADYYSIEVDGHNKGSPEWVHEYEYSLGDDSELIDWCSNNMNWEDLEGHTLRREKPKPVVNYEEEWGNAEKEIRRRKS